VSLSDPRNPNSLSVRFRQKRDVRLRELLLAARVPGRTTRIFDMGGTVRYWHRLGVDFLREHDFSVTILNLTADEFDADAPGPFELMVGNACHVDAPDGAFDFVHSNSVIEHLLTWENMRDFAREAARLAPSYYIQTPNFWFPIDPHFYKAPLFHWLPVPARVALLRSFPIAYRGRIGSREEALAVVEGAKLLSRRQIVSLFPDARIESERLAGLDKSIIAVRS
jgi:hypothetical protein